MTEETPFQIDLAGLKSRRKGTDDRSVATADATASEHGFITREGGGRRGRQPSPRTGQVHAKVLPHISDAIAEEAQRRGVTQGVVIEDAWALYHKERNGR
jgi:hypothetical protein